jgi:hypothetical protein
MLFFRSGVLLLPTCAHLQALLLNDKEREPHLFFVSLAKAKMARNAAFISLLEREGLSAAEIGASYILNMYQNTIY